MGHVRRAMKFLLSLLATVAACGASDYSVVISKATAADPAWKKVADALVAKHPGAVVTTWDAAVTEALPALRREFPRHACFVATPAEATAAFVADVHRLTRKLDDDAYTDVFWGILTGFDAENALAIASETAPLTVKRVASGTDLALDRVEEGVCYDELVKGHSTVKKPGGEPRVEKAPDDTTEALVKALNDGAPDLFVTSGHATERDWMIGFRYRNGFFKSKAGAMRGEDTKGGVFPVKSGNPKVYLPIGNCLMGHIDGPDAMALAWMKSAGVRQMLGYTKPTWFGYMGWGVLDYFVEQPGRFTLTEAFFANQAALVHKLSGEFPELAKVETCDDMGRCTDPDAPAAAEKATASEGNGLLFDRDVVAFYGDPAWPARMAPGKLNWEQTLTTAADGGFTLEVKPLAGAASFEPVNKNGSQRGGRPIVHFFEKRIDPAKLHVTEGAALKPVVTDTFVLVPLPASGAEPVRVTFAAE